MKFDKERVNTGATLANQKTRALIVRNEGAVALTGRVQFWARFPVKESLYPKPVIVHNDKGRVVASRLVLSEIQQDATLPVGKVWWECKLEWVAANIPAHGWRTWWASFYEPSHNGYPVQLAHRTNWESLPLLPVEVFETECHGGDLPAYYAPVQTQPNTLP